MQSNRLAFRSFGGGACNLSPGRPIPDEPTRLRILRGDDWVDEEVSGSNRVLGDSDSENSEEDVEGYSAFENSEVGSCDNMSLTSFEGDI